MPISDYIEERDEQTVLDGLLARLPAGIDRSEGGFPWDVLSPTAIEFVLANERLRLALEWVFAQTTFGELLDLRAEEHGVIRHPAVAASGVLRFTGDVGTIIPRVAVSTESSEGVIAQVFTTDLDAEIPADGFVDVPATAELPGSAGNVGANEVHIPEAPIPGVTSVTNPAAIEGGTDVETDEALLARYLQRVRNPSTSGNIDDYVNWALEVPGVGGVAVVPLESGPGTVTVVVVDLDKNPPGAPLVAAVQEHLAPGGANTGTGKAPVGAAVTVEAATAMAIDVVADLTIAAGFVTADVEAAAEAAVDAYLESIAFATDNDVKHARVVSAILDVPGVADVQTLTLNGAGTNVVVDAKEVATLGTTTWS